MANPNPNTTGLRKGKQAGNGRSVRLSAYMTPELSAQFEQATSSMTAYEKARVVARWIEQGLRELETEPT